MASIYSWESFIRIHGGEPGARDVFEKAMDELLRAENPGKEVHVVKAAPGDGGIDVYVHHEDGIDIYQCKFFMGLMDSSRWNQIYKSFSKAMEPKGVKVLRWVLCMPREMQQEDIAKWDEFMKERSSYGVEIKHIDGNEIISRMREGDREYGTDLVERYFESKSELLGKSLTSYIPTRPETGLIGRDSVVQKVRAMLDDTELFVLVSGLGGIGKTAVMQELCNNILEDGISKNHVAWITCGDSLEDDLLALRDPLGVPKGLGMEEAYKAVIGELQSFDGTLYLFMDDMARMPDSRELGILNSLRPKVHIMITSRHEIGRIRKIDLTELDQDPAIKMFYGYYEYDKEAKYRDDARIIVESVNRHTLLVELLAKAAKQSFDTLDVFRKKLEAKGFFDVSQDKLDVGEDNTTIEDCVRKLYSISKLSLEQQRIMSLFTIFTPEKEIYGRVAEWAGLDRNAVNDLVKLGWLARTKEGFVIHQIVRDSLARQVGDSLKLEEYGKLLFGAAYTDAYMPQNLEYTKIRERLVFAEDVARNLEGRAKRLLDIGEYHKKDRLVLVSSARLFNNMAGVYYAQGEYEKAQEYYRKALKIYEDVLGTEHPLTATTYNNMAVVYEDQGEYEKTLGYYEKALAIQEEALGTEHPSTASTYNNIAEIYCVQGVYEKAQEYNGKARAIREQVLGAKHPETATTYNNIASVYFEQREYEKALDYYGKARTIREQVLGAEHPETAMTYNNMAVVYYAQGEYEKALEYYGRALAIVERVLGSDHPNTATMYNNTALVYYALGEYEKAREYHGKALAIVERVYGAEHPETATTYNNMALVYHAQGEYEKALEYYGKALAIVERVLGSDHPNIATMYYNMAGVYCTQGEYEKAQELYGKAISVQMVKLSENHSDTQDTDLSGMIMKKLVELGISEEELMETIARIKHGMHDS